MAGYRLIHKKPQSKRTLRLGLETSENGENRSFCRNSEIRILRPNENPIVPLTPKLNKKYRFQTRANRFIQSPYPKASQHPLYAHTVAQAIAPVAIDRNRDARQERFVASARHSNADICLFKLLEAFTKR